MIEAIQHCIIYFHILYKFVFSPIHSHTITLYKSFHNSINNLPVIEVNFSTSTERTLLRLILVLALVSYSSTEMIQSYETVNVLQRVPSIDNMTNHNDQLLYNLWIKSTYFGQLWLQVSGRFQNIPYSLSRHHIKGLWYNCIIGIVMAGNTNIPHSGIWEKVLNKDW